METYVDVFMNVDGEKASVIHDKLIKLGFKPTIGEYDFVYNWNGIVSIDEEIKLIDRIQEELKGTGVILKFKTMR